MKLTCEEERVFRRFYAAFTEVFLFRYFNPVFFIRVEIDVSVFAIINILFSQISKGDIISWLFGPRSLKIKRLVMGY